MGEAIKALNGAKAENARMYGLMRAEAPLLALEAAPPAIAGMWCSDVAHVEFELAESCLSRRVGSAVSRAYARTPVLRAISRAKGRPR